MSTLTQTHHSNVMSRITKRTEFTLGIVVAALFVIASFGTENFLSKYNIQNLMKQGAIVGVLAVAQTVIIITGGIDISCGAIAGMGCMVMALLMRDGSTNFFTAAAICFAVCILAGFLNGVIIYDLKVPAMIATLGTQAIFRGIIKIMCGGLSVTFTDDRIMRIGTGKVFDFVPILAVFWILVAIFGFLLLRYTVFGRNLYVIGSGMEVARLNGVKTRKTFYLVYSFAGLLYGVAALMFAGRVVQAQPGTGAGYEMDSIAAAVIGGASLTGGRGMITGTLMGTLLMAIIKNAGDAFQISPYVLEVVTGALIIFAVAMDMIKTRKKA